jgi:hypothetical protein
LLEPRWFAGSCPDSHSGGGTGFGAGGGTGGAAFAAVEGLARTGITDSSLARFAAGSCGSLPPLMVFISLVAANQFGGGVISLVAGAGCVFCMLKTRYVKILILA